jgi:hypothetical protein
LEVERQRFRARLLVMPVRERASTLPNAIAAKGLVSSRGKRRFAFVAPELESTMESLAQNVWARDISRHR